MHLRHRHAMLLLVFLALLAGSLPAAAFEALTSALARLPASAVEKDTGLVFDYLSPRQVRYWRLQDNPGTGDDGANNAIVDPGGAMRLTGINFQALDTILVFGTPPARGMFVAGPELDGETVAAAFRAREGFEESTEAGATIFARGEDFRMNPADRDRNDPFGGLLGTAQRIAIGPHGVVFMRAWAPLRDALPLASDIAARSEADVALGRTFSTMAALAAARDPNAEAFAACGFSMAAFRLREPRSEEEAAGQGAAPAGIGSFDYALFVAAEGPVEEAAYLVVAFPDHASAEAAGPILRDRLRDFIPADQRVDAPVVQAVTVMGAAGLVTAAVIYTKSDAHPAARQLMNWRQAVYRRGFTPLAFE